MQSYFRMGKIFSILSKYWQVRKYAALLSEFSFQKKRKKFRMVNSSTGGTKDFVEAWDMIDLKISTHFSIR